MHIAAYETSASVYPCTFVVTTNMVTNVVTVTTVTSWVPRYYSSLHSYVAKMISDFIAVK